MTACISDYETRNINMKSDLNKAYELIKSMAGKNN